MMTQNASAVPREGGARRIKGRALDLTPLPSGSGFHVLFVYPNVQRVHTPQLGIASLSACVKQIGARSALLDTTLLDPGSECDALARRLAADRPDLVAFGVRSSEWGLARELLAVVRRFQLPVVVGGPQATFCPEDTLAECGRIVRGEGEGAMLDLVRAMAAGRPCDDIANVWSRRDGRIIRNAVRELIPDLDALPLPDWRLFDDVHYRQSYARNIRPGTRIVAALEGSRGCPFTCTYCSNERLQREYRGLGRWRREKSPRRMVDELLAFRASIGPVDFVHWIDEIWLTRVERLAEFRDLYRREIGAPFCIMERPESVTDEKLRIMAEAGLYSIAIGLESGDEDLRRKVLGRRTSQARMLSAFTLPHKYGVRVHAFTMLGLPNQDEASMMRTWRFLRRVRPDTAQFSIFYPLAGTRLYDQTIAAGLFRPTGDMRDYYTSSPLVQPGIDNDRIVKYRRLFDTYVTRPGPWSALQFHLARKWNAPDRIFAWKMRARMRLGAARRAAAAALRAIVARGFRRLRPSPAVHGAAQAS